MAARIDIPPQASRRLWLLRHAKAMPRDELQSDSSRELSERGRLDAEAMAKALSKAGLRASLIVSSSAKRAFSTAKAFADALDVKSITVDNSVYEADAGSLLALVRKLPDKCKSVLIVGHNPAISECAAELCPEACYELSAGALAGLDFDALSWDSIKTGSGRLVLILGPKEL